MIQCVETEQFTMEYFTFGTGSRPFVILPGASLRSVMLSEAAVRGAYQIFAETHQVYVFDIKQDPEPEYGVHQMAEDTAAAMEKLGLYGCDMMGCSLGGMIAQYLAAEHPDMVRSLVLASTVAVSVPPFRQVAAEWQRLSEEGDPVPLNRSVAGRVYSEAFYRACADAFALLESMGTEAELRRFGVLMAACQSFDARPVLERLRCPVLAVGAEDDRVTTAEGIRQLQKALHCESYIYPGYSHAVYDEAPDFKERIMTFFRKAAAESAGDTEQGGKSGT